MKTMILLMLGTNKGGGIAKFCSILSASIMLSPISFIGEKLYDWRIENEAYMGFVIGAIIVDHILGSMYHAFWKRDFSLKKNLLGFLVKVIILISMMYLFEGLNTLMAEQSILKDYTKMILRMMVFLYPAGSAFGNTYEMTGKKFPPVGFMDKLKQFSESNNIKG